ARPARCCRCASRSGSRTRGEDPGHLRLDHRDFLLDTNNFVWQSRSPAQVIGGSTMEFTEALDQISEIHEHMAKGEVYGGFRSLPVALSGVCGLMAAAVQPLVVAPGDPSGGVAFWAMAGGVAGVVGGSELLFNYLFRDDPFAKRRTRRVVGQFVPCLAAGVAVTVGLTRAAGEALIGLLPGLWAILFGLGIFSARPYLPRALGWVALSY